MASIQERSLKLHEEKKGKLEVRSKVPLKTRDDFSLAYTPGVAEPCRDIVRNKENVYKYTIKGNSLAVITDGSAVLGLGNIGPEAALPVMEGKAAIFKEFAGIDAFPICLAQQDIRKNIETIRNIAPVFGAINLEDFAAPACFEIECSLQDLGIPVMHDDQHGTAIAVLAALINALKVVDKGKDVRITISGAGAAGIAVTKLLVRYGFSNILVWDREGIIYEGRRDLRSKRHKLEISYLTNKEKMTGTLSDALVGADVFIGVSAKNLVTAEMVRNMNADAIVIAMANPDPEILPPEAKKGGARIVATGRSDFPNQVNNALVFPGVFRGALDVRASRITEDMKVAAAEALAAMVKNPSEENILPPLTDRSVAGVVAAAVAASWKKNPFGETTCTLWEKKWGKE